MLIAGFFALGPLDANPAGIALIVLALVLFAAEIFVVGFGVLGIGGIISLLLGGLFCSATRRSMRRASRSGRWP